MVQSRTTTLIEPAIQWWGPSENPEKITDEYRTERGLRWKLLTAPRSRRAALYADAYEEVLRRSYEDINRRQFEILKDRAHARDTFRALRRFVKAGHRVVELGPGHGRVSRLLSEIAAHVTMVDVRSALARDAGEIDNLSLIVTKGTRIPIARNSVDVVFSDQLIEHLHPDDAFQMHCEVFNAMAPGGVLICYTPNRVLGPHDLSRYFGKYEPDGLHLVEYSITELATLLRSVGFQSVRPLIGGKWMWIPMPLFILAAVESVLDRLRPSQRLRLVRFPLVKQGLKVLLGARVVARKPLDGPARRKLGESAFLRVVARLLHRLSPDANSGRSNSHGQPDARF
ncbi:MAG TPA: class I SAM-dependent methyltransferase [Caulobacteraceae bacterium]|jgi:SAM-dependent methyltransferase|nr:class I SAM-dependent methyltransferase [Caulobacteraceae bacterium]